MFLCCFFNVFNVKFLHPLFFVFFLSPPHDSQCFVPAKVEGLVQRHGELIGRLHYKEGHDLYHWRTGWFLLEGSALHYSPGEEEGEEEVLQLKQLQELSKQICICISQHVLHFFLTR